MFETFHDQEYQDYQSLAGEPLYTLPAMDIVPAQDATADMSTDYPAPPVIVANEHRRGISAASPEQPAEAPDVPPPSTAHGDGDGPIDPPRGDRTSSSAEDPEERPANSGDAVAPLEDSRPDDLKQFPADPELHRAAAAALGAVGPERLDPLLRSNQRFNQYTLASQPGIPREDSHFWNKQFLNQLPAYAAAIEQAAAPPDKADELLTHVLETEPHPDMCPSNVSTALVSRIFEGAAETGDTVSAGEIERLKEVVTRTVAADSRIGEGLRAYNAARRAGQPAEASAALVEGYLAACNPTQDGYNIREFTETLETLHAANASPDAVKTVFQGVMAERGPEVVGVLGGLREGITFGSLDREQRASEYMEDLAGRIRDGATAKEAIEQMALRPPGLVSESRLPARPPEAYFTPKEGSLTHAAIPYRAELPFSDGIRDLQKLTEADPYQGEKLAEGAWIYDPATSTWYSMGGTTTFTKFAGHHRSAAYDIRKLSESPVSVHLHPGHMGREPDKFGYLFPTAADWRAIADMQQIAQGEAPLRSIISSPLGITEFTYPNDSEAVRALAGDYAGYHQELLNKRLGSSADIRMLARNMTDQGLAQACLNFINSQLPRGFVVRLHPHNADFDHILRGIDR